MSLAERVAETLAESVRGPLPPGRGADGARARHRQRSRRRAAGATVALALIGGAVWALVPSSPEEVVTADSPETTDASDADLAQGASSPESTGEEAPVAADADPPELLVTCVTALGGEVPSDLKAAIAEDGEILELAGTGVSGDRRFGVCSDAINRMRPGTSEWTPGVVGLASSSEHYEEVLADGEVGFAEYEAAIRNFMACARDGGVEIQDLEYDEDFQRFPYEYSGGWRSVALVDACEAWHLLQVEFEWQRQQGMLDLDLDEATRFMAKDIAESVTRRLGVAIPEGDWVQIRSAWTRYPYGDGPEADDAVFRFMSDFAWMGGDELDISVVNYSPIDPSSRWFPIVTVTSTDDPDRAAVFVMRWDPDDHDVVIERLPDSSARPPVVAPEIETTAPGSTVVFEGIGVEGSPAAYVNGVEIEAVSDHEALETVVTLPGELPERFTLTLVIPGPEIPSAIVLVLGRG